MLRFGLVLEQVYGQSNNLYKSQSPSIKPSDTSECQMMECFRCDLTEDWQQQSVSAFHH